LLPSPPTSTLFPYTTLFRSARFEKDRDSDEVKGLIAADEKRASALGVKTTPSIFINNQPIPSVALHPSALRATLDAATKPAVTPDRKSTRLNSSHLGISYAV